MWDPLMRQATLGDDNSTPPESEIWVRGAWALVIELFWKPARSTTQDSCRLACPQP